MITRLALQNFVAFREVELTLSRLTLLSGTNSAGKSSLLHALSMLRQSHSADVLDSSWLLNGDLIELGTGKDVLHSSPNAMAGLEDFAIGIEVDDIETTLRSVARYAPENDVLSVIDSNLGMPEAASFLRSQFQYLKADRITPSVTYPKSHEAVSVRRSLGSRGEHTANFLRVHSDDAIANLVCQHPNALSLGYIDQTNAWLNELSLGTGLTVRDVPGTDFVSLGFDRQGPDVRTDVQRATNVGFGLTYVLPVIVGCLAAEADSTLMIENPEAHLHPAGQAMIGQLAAIASTGGAQVIVETHSDHVLNAIRLLVKEGSLAPNDVKVYFFSRVDGVLNPVVTSLALNSDGTIPSWPSGFFDQWDRALDQLLD